MRHLVWAAFVVALAGFGAAGSAIGGQSESSSSTPRLTRAVPENVTKLCVSARRSRPPLPIVCPPLIPVTRYWPYPGVHGVLLGNTNRPPLKPPTDRIYMLGFNAGASGPTTWHWIAGMGSREALRYWVLSDERNEVKGKPTRVRTEWIARRKVEIWRFPDHPAGGQFGGHYAAITPSGPYFAVASIHGDNANASARMAVALASKADAAR
jgi:hypothetical protein